ncbi:MAG: DPP IV N-terminal domain-containing protein, partial [Dinghuibacter sp.]|nr:DPP IV N-terminal domain-containing protein [Dinghuibacter sp.]
SNWIMNLHGAKISLNPVSGQATTLLDKNFATKENAEESRAGHTAYLENHNLFVAINGTPVQLTTDGSADIVYASSVHRDEFGISKGIFWSNNGKTLAFYRMDQTMVTDYPIINWTKQPAINEPTKYPMAGGKSHHVTIGVYHTETRKLVYLNTGAPAEQYLTNIAWGPNDEHIYVAILNREQNHMRLNQYDAATGAFIKTLFEEKDEHYVEPLKPMLFLNNNPSQFIWQSNRDGWNHLYLYNTSGQMLKQLTQGSWEVTEVKGFDAKNEHLFYTATQESPLTRNLYQLNLKKGTVKRITAATGNHATLVSTNGDFVIDNYSNTTTPRIIQLTETKTGKTKTLLQAANPLQDYYTTDVHLFSIKNKQGDDLFCRMYKPLGFDAAKKYPVIVYWYGGPHVQLILNNWMGGASDYWFQYMAAKGYLVFSLDPRGSDNRGRAFEQAVHRNIGDAQTDDLDAGVHYLASLPYADTARMGLFGWSFGGFLTTNYMLSRPNVFKAAVAGGPVMDWSLYEIMYTERYMDTPAENPDGYEHNNMIKQAGNLKGKLLLIHGLQDPVVVQQHSVNFVKSCVDKGVQVDYMIYPGHEHNVLGKDRAHLYRKVTDYLELHLNK